MTDKHTPVSRYFLTELNDGIQWLTDGQDFGMNAASVPELLETLERISNGPATINASTSPESMLATIQDIVALARIAIRDAKGDL